MTAEAPDPGRPGRYLDPVSSGVAPSRADDEAPVPVPAAVEAEEAEEPGPYLPPAVRRRVVSVAADLLGSLEATEVPGSLRPFARFTPARRARLAAVPIAAALEAEPSFRHQVGDRLRTALPDVADAVQAGTPPPAAAPEDVAAFAYLLRPPGWRVMVDEAAAASQLTRVGSADQAAGELAGALREQLVAARAAFRADLERARAALAAARSETAALRRELRVAREDAQRAQQRAAAAAAATEAVRAEAARSVAASESDNRRLRSRAEAAEAAVDTARRASREGRAVDDMRLRLLLDTVLGAATGLRRELALPALTDRPADEVAAALGPGTAAAGAPVRAYAEDDPALLDQLLALPTVHLIVDGYNVTKSGYGGLPLEAQRRRLITGVAGLAAQTGAEVTVAFDGAEKPTAAAPAAPRGVRVLFSPLGQIADELIRRLVAAEPPGRPVVVVSSDREVADAARRSGARALPATSLLRRLG